MSCDKLVYDLASETEGSPNVFVRKDWLNILDNQNQNYTSNQSIVDTSQLSNSNKWLSYREAYFEIPLLLSMGSSVVGTGVIGGAGFIGYDQAVAGQAATKVIGLKNWFGQIIHSFTLDYNGTTIIQQTPFINMWNTFKLLTTLSYQELKSLGPHIGFYPDDSEGWEFNTIARASGIGTCNNLNIGYVPDVTGFGIWSQTDTRNSAGEKSNTGFSKRQSWISYDPFSPIGTGVGPAAISANGAIITQATSATMWRSYVFGRAGAAGAGGLVQMAIMATVYLKHIHSFFNMCPLLKGVYMKMTMNLNNCSSSITSTAAAQAAVGAAYIPGTLTLTSVSVPSGGVVPFLVSSADGVSAQHVVANVGGSTVFSAGTALTAPLAQVFWANLSVGRQITDPTAVAALTVAGVAPGTGGVATSIYLYVPAYTFNPVFEQAYLSSPVKTVKYTDVYQYQVQSVAPGSFNTLITNGISNIKSVLVIPFFAGNTAASGLPLAVPVFQSPFDTAGCGTTSPYIQLNNFNVVVSGQNAIYNTERYTFEHFVNQTYGVNAVNGGLTDGLSSGLIGFDDWMSNYGYYYTNVERMLPVEQSVPKSIQLMGVNATLRELSLWVFIEYGSQVQIDTITGARV